MPDEKASTTNQAKFKLRPGDWWQIGILHFFLFSTSAFFIAEVMLNHSPSEISFSLLGMMLAPGLFLYVSFHSAMVFRVAKLEQRLAELEASRRS